LLLACGGGGGGGGAEDVSHEEREPLADVPVTLPEAGIPDSLPDPGGCDDCDAPDAADAQSDSSAEVLPGQPGAACKKNGDCVSGFCIETLEGRQCAEYCFAGEDTCPPGYRCSQVQAYPDTLYVCVFLYPRLCRPCSGDEDCTAQLAPGPSVCIPADPAGRFCGSPCEAASDCPPGYDCHTVTTLAGAQVQQCVRSAGECTCVNTTWSGEQVNPAVAALPGGGLVVVWQSDAQDGDSWGVFARVADASGAFPAGELQVNAYTAGAQSQPRVVALGSNDFVVVWQSYGQDGDGTGVFGRRLPSSGTTFGPEYAVNLSTAADQSNPAISRLSDDRVIVVWQSDTAVPGVREIRWRILAADGAPASGEYTANTPVSTATCSWPDVAVFADNRFVIAWEREEGGDSDVYARWFASDGSPQGAETRLNVEAMGDQLRPRLGAIPDGRLVATWMSDGQDGSYFGVFVRRFDADRLPAGGEFQANTFYTGEQSFPAVSTDATGGALVVWQSLGQDGSGYGVYGRRFP